MKVIVIGSGVVGITTAHYLARAGADVTVLDQNDEPAMGTSYANAGSMTASRSGPWASPRVLVKTMKGYFADDAAFRIRPDGRSAAVDLAVRVRRLGVFDEYGGQAQGHDRTGIDQRRRARGNRGRTGA